MKKDLNSREYWAAFGRGAISNQQLPTAAEASATISRLMSAVEDADKRTREAKRAALDSFRLLRGPIADAFSATELELHRLERSYSGHEHQSRSLAEVADDSTPIMYDQ